MKKTNEELYQNACEYFYRNNERLRGDYDSLIEPTLKQLDLFAKLVSALHVLKNVNRTNNCLAVKLLDRASIKELYIALDYQLSIRQIYVASEFVNVDLDVFYYKDN